MSTQRVSVSGFQAGGPTSPENFYVVGGTLARDAACYVERTADKRLLMALQQSEICYVLTSRQMGKSSLMVRTAVRLRAQRTSVAVLDLTSLGQNLTAMQWYNGLIERTGQQLSLEDEVEDAWVRFEHLGPFQRWMQTMRQVVLPACREQLVVFIDEIDTVRSLPFATDEFFAGIRELYNRRSEDPDLKRLTFCLLGVATPSDLIRDTRTTPFNVGRRIELTDFNEEEAAPLASGMGREPSVGQRLVKRILYWTGGQPYLTQRLCQAVSEARIDTTKGVDERCNDLFLSSRARERDDNLLFVRDRILRSEIDTASLLTLYSKVRDGKKVRYDEASPLIGVLRLSGITAIEDGYLRVRNRIYERVFDQQWIISNLPGSEIRRQRAAYKKGFKRAALALVPLVLLLAYEGYLLFTKTTTPELPQNISKHVSPPVFWLSSSMRSPSTAVGSLLVKAGDENVMVFINNQLYGTTGKGGELLVPGLPVGSYNIRVEKPGFQTVSSPGVAVFANNASELSIQLQRLVTSGIIKIADALPGTTVLLDGNPAGETDANGSLSVVASPGNHDLDLSKDGYLSSRLTQLVTLGGTASVSGRLKVDEELREWRELANNRDPEAFWAFRQKYTQGRFAADAIAKAQKLEWNTVQDSNDLTKLDAFVKRYPEGQFAADARNRIQQIEKEEEDYRSIVNSVSPADLQQFLANHPNGKYAANVRQQMATLQDRKAILAVLQQYQDAYDRKDLDAIAHLWPKCPDGKKRNLTALFSSGQAGTLKIEPKGPPEFAGADQALVKCGITRISPGATSTRNADVRFMKEGDSWFIESGQL